MHKTLAITTIVLVAVIMGISAIATAIPVANAVVGCPNDPPNGFWVIVPANDTPRGDQIDKNGDGALCNLVIPTPQGLNRKVFVDNRF